MNVFLFHLENGDQMDGQRFEATQKNDIVVVFYIDIVIVDDVAEKR